MTGKTNLTINNLSLSKSFKRKRWDRCSRSKKMYEVSYLKNVSIEFNTNDKVRLHGKDTEGRNVLIKVLSSKLHVPDGTVVINGDVFSGTNPFFGILPQATVEENLLLRAFRLGFSYKDAVEFSMGILDKVDFNKFRTSLFGNLNRDTQILIINETLKPVCPQILVLDQWMMSESIEIKSKIEEVLRALIIRSKISVVSINRPDFINFGSEENPYNREICLENGEVVCDNKNP